MCDVSTCGVDDAVCVCDISTCGVDDAVPLTSGVCDVTHRSSR